MHLPGRLEDLVGPSMHSNSARCCAMVEQPHITPLLMKAHEAVDFGDSLERSVNRRLHLRRGRIRDRNLDESAEQRLRPANAI